MSRRWPVLLAVLLQIGTVAAIVVDKEWILHRGRELVVQTAPIDPRDIFRGDYVRLDYLFSRIPAAQVDPALLHGGLRKGERLWLAMRPARGGVMVAARVQKTRPNFPYLRGRVVADWPMKKTAEGRQVTEPLRLDFGIGRYYVEQGRGRVLEQIRGRRDDFQRAMRVRLAVAENGEALIRDFDWADLSVRTSLLVTPEADAPEERASAVIRLSLRNETDRPVTLGLKPDGCSFDLIPAGAFPGPVALLTEERSAFCAGRESVPYRLEPQGILDIDIDFNQPGWRATVDGELKPLGRLPWPYRWRLVYRDSLPEGLRGRIVSRAFHPGGQVD